MTDTFTASNGAHVHVTSVGNFKTIQVQTVDNRIDLAGVHVDALREFFQHKRDEELGRWRWPENAEYVVYPTNVKSRVRVLRETGVGDLEWVDRGDERSYEFCHAARAYFEAHPEPKPWQNAKPGEVWVLWTADGEDAAYSVMSVRESGIVFESHEGRYSLGDTDITNARRIWPEGPK